MRDCVSLFNPFLSDMAVPIWPGAPFPKGVWLYWYLLHLQIQIAIFVQLQLPKNLKLLKKKVEGIWEPNLNLQ